MFRPFWPSPHNPHEIYLTLVVSDGDDGVPRDLTAHNAFFGSGTVDIDQSGAIMGVQGVRIITSIECLIYIQPFNSIKLSGATF